MRRLVPAKPSKTARRNAKLIDVKVTLPAGWAKPTPKMPAGAAYDDLLRFQKGGDLWEHENRKRGLHRLVRNVQALEVVLTNTLMGCTEFLPEFNSRFNQVQLRSDLTAFLNAVRVLASEELAHASVADVENLGERHSRYATAMREESRARSNQAAADRRPLRKIPEGSGPTSPLRPLSKGKGKKRQVRRDTDRLGEATGV